MGKTIRDLTKRDIGRQVEVFKLVQVDIQTAKLQVKLLFKYSEFVAESGEVGVAEYEKAVTKLMKSGTLYHIGIRSVAVSE